MVVVCAEVWLGWRFSVWRVVRAVASSAVANRTSSWLVMMVAGIPTIAIIRIAVVVAMMATIAAIARFACRADIIHRGVHVAYGSRVGRPAVSLAR